MLNCYYNKYKLIFINGINNIGLNGKFAKNTYSIKTPWAFLKLRSAI